MVAVGEEERKEAEAGGEEDRGDKTRPKEDCQGSESADSSPA